MSARKGLGLAGLLALVCWMPARAQYAADLVFDPARMAEARADLYRHHGAKVVGLFLGERTEVQTREANITAVWEAQGWLGSDRHKWWVKTEGERALAEGAFDEVEFQSLYSRAVTAFWDVQTGVRYDVRPGPSSAYAVLAVQGLAPYLFEVDASVFFSDRGTLSARLELEYELRFTQRLLLQPRLEINGAFADDRSLGLRAGVTDVEAGLRLRYELRREFAPYVGAVWAGPVGASADLAGAASPALSFVGGVRFWF